MVRGHTNTQRKRDVGGGSEGKEGGGCGHKKLTEGTEVRTGLLSRTVLEADQRQRKRESLCACMVSDIWESGLEWLPGFGLHFILAQTTVL